MYFSIWTNNLNNVLVAILGYTCIWTKNRYHILVIGYTHLHIYIYLYTCRWRQLQGRKYQPLTSEGLNYTAGLSVCYSYYPLQKKNIFVFWGFSLYLVYFLFTVETKINKDLKFHSFVILMKWFYRDLILKNVFQHSLYFFIHKY